MGQGSFQCTCCESASSVRLSPTKTVPVAEPHKVIKEGQGAEDLHGSSASKASRTEPQVPNAAESVVTKNYNSPWEHKGPTALDHAPSASGQNLQSVQSLQEQSAQESIPYAHSLAEAGTGGAPVTFGEPDAAAGPSAPADHLAAPVYSQGSGANGDPAEDTTQEGEQAAPLPNSPSKGILKSPSMHDQAFDQAGLYPRQKRTVSFNRNEAEIIEIQNLSQIALANAREEEAARERQKKMKEQFRRSEKPCLSCLPCGRPGLSKHAKKQLTALFRSFDKDASSEITLEEAQKFWSKGFSKVGAEVMFSEVDADGDGTITLQEFLAFWERILLSGHTEKEILQEVSAMIDGGAWVEWQQSAIAEKQGGSGEGNDFTVMDSMPLAQSRLGMTRDSVASAKQAQTRK